jgi:hypothetical protein
MFRSALRSFLTFLAILEHMNISSCIVVYDVQKKKKKYIPNLLK